MGVVKVRWNGVTLGKLSLYSATDRRRVFKLPSFASVRTGSVVIKVVSPGARVEIDGLGIAH